MWEVACPWGKRRGRVGAPTPSTFERSTAVTVRRTFTALVPSVTPALSSRRHIDLVRVASSGCR